MAEMKWDDFWSAMGKVDTEEAQVRLAHALNASGPFPDWLLDRGDPTILEVLTGAPVQVVAGFAPALPKELVEKLTKPRPRSEQAQIAGAYNQRRLKSTTTD